MVVTAGHPLKIFPSVSYVLLVLTHTNRNQMIYAGSLSKLQHVQYTLHNPVCNPWLECHGFPNQKSPESSNKNSTKRSVRSDKSAGSSVSGLFLAPSNASIQSYPISGFIGSLMTDLNNQVISFSC